MIILALRLTAVCATRLLSVFLDQHVAQTQREQRWNFASHRQYGTDNLTIQIDYDVTEDYTIAQLSPRCLWYSSYNG